MKNASTLSPASPSSMSPAPVVMRVSTPTRPTSILPEPLLITTEPDTSPSTIEPARVLAWPSAAASRRMEPAPLCASTTPNRPCVSMRPAPVPISGPRCRREGGSRPRRRRRTRTSSASSRRMRTRTGASPALLELGLVDHIAGEELSLPCGAVSAIVVSAVSAASTLMRPFGSSTRSLTGVGVWKAFRSGFRAHRTHPCMLRPGPCLRPRCSRPSRRS